MLLLVRHGDTRVNADGLLLGRADPPLTDLGRRQATALAAALPRPERVVSSPLARARETAAAFGLPVEIDERWIELDYGELDCRPASSLPEVMWDRWREDASFVPAGGESFAALSERVRAACEDLAAEAARRHVVVVTHVSPIKAAVAWALGVGIEVVWRMWVESAAYCRIAVTDRGPLLRSFNEHYGFASTSE